MSTRGAFQGGCHIEHVRIAVVGAGLIGRRHIEIASALASLDAIVDPDPDAADIAAAKGTEWHADFATYLGQRRPDGVIIATPNGCHLAQGKLCVDAGLPVLIEKPLAENAADAVSLARHADSRGGRILVGHHRRHSLIAQAAKQALDEGRLGRIATVNAMFWLHKPADYFQADWRKRPGGGPTYINLIHDVDLLQYFCGPIIRAQAREASHIRGFQVEDTCAVIVEFESGALGTISISDTVSAPWSWEMTSGENAVYPKTDQTCYAIGGTRGSLSVPDLRLWTHEGQQSWWSPIGNETLTSERNDPIVAQFMHFLDVIHGRAEPLVSAQLGARNIAVLDAIKAAARQGGSRDVDDFLGGLQTLP